ncbi:MAG TPA: ATP-binding protein, partial [Polyangiaceae bacterium]|nr:ATP-binding protein [Polyangiaceae bacterium]
GKLLASSRLDFDALEAKPLLATEAARRALELAGLEAVLLDDHSHGAHVEADPTLLGRALANLLDNARTHGSGVRKLALKREAPGSERRRDNASYVVFEVLDQGPGFAAEDLPRVFEPFFRSGERGHGSLGLGLSLVDRIARAHGGRAFAANSPEGGASVGVKLPLSTTD